MQAFTVADPQHASNVAIAHGETLQKITNEGDDQLAKVALGEVRAIHWLSKEGISLEGIVTFPTDFQVRRDTYPFMVLPHGGPEANDSLRLDRLPALLRAWGMSCYSRSIAAQPVTELIS